MSTSLAAVQVSPSYGESQDPLVAPQLELWTTSVPSRSRTVSRVVHLSQREPPMPQNHDDFYSPVDSNPVRKFLTAISILRSLCSDGQTF
jgi:hypothetical protein